MDVVTHASALERVTELAVIVSLFTAGLKLRVPVLDRRWLIAVRLAVVSMTMTVALVATAVVAVLGRSPCPPGCHRGLDPQSMSLVLLVFA